MIIYIKNMVCNRCIMAVQNVFTSMGIAINHIALGEVQVEKDLTATQQKQLQQALEALGFELMNDKNAQIIEKIKTIIIDLIQNQNNELSQNLSSLLSKQLHQDYKQLSQLFSDVEGTTIEQYYIAQKIEKVKELLVYDELSLSQIADQLNYSSVSYLSNQFKKVTGLRPQHFKQIKAEKRKPLDKV